MITEPGVYQIPDKAYHADPAESPSLSAGMITQLLQAPAKCYEASPRLNPNYEQDESPDRFTIGTVRHVMFLEPHLFSKKVVVCEFDDWRKNEAKEKRDRAKASGLTPILEKHMEKIHAARKSFYANSFTAKAFEGGKFEQSMFWRHPTYGFWCRARPDFIHDSGVHMNDYKTTSNANPSEFGRHAWNMGYHRRAAWYLEGAQIVLGKKPEHYWFVNQEVEPPYLISVCELDVNALEAGQQQNDEAARIFARCLSVNKWPGYRKKEFPDQDRAFQVSMPNYAFIQIDQGAY